MLIDCDACVMKGLGCQDCVVTVVLGMSADQGSIRIDDEERAALDVLAQSGLVPPLRLVHAVSSVEPDIAADRATDRPADHAADHAADLAAGGASAADAV